VLVNGTTGAAGTLAVQLAKYLGAGKVIARGRDATALQRVAGLGADITISLLDTRADVQDSFAEQFGGHGVDVILDNLYGQWPRRCWPPSPGPAALRDPFATSRSAGSAPRRSC
jgi:NADPH:quinone reductase-like Zn-dependent oxidoreductase